PARGQYAYDTLGRVVRTTVIGDCVYTSYWTPETATPECNPDLFARFRAPAPTAEPEPAPAPAPYEAMEYAEAPDYEPAPYEEPPAAVEEPPQAEAVEFAEETEEFPEEAEEFAEEAEEPALAAEEPPVAVEEPAAEVVEFAEEAEEFPEEAEEVAEEAEEPALAAEEPLEDFYAPGDAPDLVPVPSEFAEEGPDDRVGDARMYYEEEEGAAPDEGIVGSSQYYEEEEGVQQDDGIIARNEYYEEEEGVEQDDGIISQSQYYEEEGVEQDEGIIGQSQYYEEEGVEQDEGIIGQSQYYEEEGVQQPEDIIARSEYYEEEGKEPEDLISEPTATEETMVAAAEEEKEAEEVVAAAEEEKEPTPVMLPVTVTLEAEPWFDFDRYAVRSDARDKLDTLATDLTGVEYDEILVVGHADRIGTPEYNQRLSERRARSVKNYLVGKGIAADRIKTEGRGEFEPATDPAFCQGLRKQKLIDCLQPDRRVEVTVTGTKLEQ
ncbi:MAG: OmpA family protein, partial [Parvularculaceae bacterium]|nr:OmpA family protein [Parvularculaceae bacterium]